MEPKIIQVVAGFTSTMIFASSKIPMLLKAFKTKDLESYSLGHIALSNAGNLIYWLYVISLPVGPIWFLQGFFTITDILMFLCYVRYQNVGEYIELLRTSKWRMAWTNLGRCWKRSFLRGEGTDMVRVADGKVVEHWGIAD